MSSPLTYWHYLTLGILLLLFLLGIIVALQSQKGKLSIAITTTLILVFLGGFIWNTINESVYKVEVSQLDEERYYQSEQIMIKGIVKNTGNFPVSNVTAIVTLINTKGGNDRKATQFAQPTVFDELFQGDDPKFKKHNIKEEHIVAKYLKPGSSKSFHIIMDYPSYFKRTHYDVTVKVN